MLHSLRVFVNKNSGRPPKMPSSFPPHAPLNLPARSSPSVVSQHVSSNYASPVSVQIQACTLSSSQQNSSPSPNNSGSIPASEFPAALLSIVFQCLPVMRRLSLPPHPHRRRHRTSTMLQRARRSQDRRLGTLRSAVVGQIHLLLATRATTSMRTWLGS